MSDDLKAVTKEPILNDQESPESVAEYCRIFNSDGDQYGCIWKPNEEACRQWAVENEAAYYSWTTEKC